MARSLPTDRFKLYFTELQQALVDNLSKYSKFVRLPKGRK